jgi:hypothetical protein
MVFVLFDFTLKIPFGRLHGAPPQVAMLKVTVVRYSCEVDRWVAVQKHNRRLGKMTRRGGIAANFAKPPELLRKE